MTMQLRIPVLAVLAALAGAAGSARAQAAGDTAALRNWIQLYGVAATWELNSVANSFGIGTNAQFNAESDLGLPRHRPYTGVQLGRRIGERWRVELDYGWGRRKGSRTLGSDLDADNVRYAAGSMLQSQVTLTTLRVTGGWSMVQTEQVEAGLLIGGHHVQLSRHLQGQGQSLSLLPPPPGASGPPPVQASASDGSDSVIWPLAGAFVSYQWTPAWRLGARLLFTNSHNVQWQAQAEWKIDRHWSVAAGYLQARHNIDGVSCFIGCSPRYLIDSLIQGPSLTFQLAF